MHIMSSKAFTKAIRAPMMNQPVLMVLMIRKIKDEHVADVEFLEDLLESLCHF